MPDTRAATDAFWGYKLSLAKGRKRLSYGSSSDRPCQRHVNERTSFFECEARRMWVNVSEFKG